MKDFWKNLTAPEPEKQLEAFDMMKAEISKCQNAGISVDIGIRNTNNNQGDGKNSLLSQLVLGHTNLDEAYKLKFILPLLKAGAQVMINQGTLGLAPIHNAARLDYASILKEMIVHGGDIHHPDVDGWTPLHWSITTKALSTTQILIEQGANIYALNNDGQTPMYLASRLESSSDMAKYMMSVEKVLKEQRVLQESAASLVIFHQNEKGSLSSLPSGDDDFIRNQSDLEADEKRGRLRRL